MFHDSLDKIVSMPDTYSVTFETQHSSSARQKLQNPHRGQKRDRSPNKRNDCPRQHHSTSGTHTLGQLTHLPLHAKWDSDSVPGPKRFKQSQDLQTPQSTHTIRAHTQVNRLNYILICKKWFQSIYENSLVNPFNTHLGRYCFKSICFGLKISHDVFQTKIVEICHRIHCIHNHLCIYGISEREHDLNLT